MPEETAVEVAQKATIHFTRKMPKEQYGSSEFGIFLPVDLPSKLDYLAEDGALLPDWYHQVDLALKDGSNLVKQLVWEQQGIQFEAVEGVLFEKLGAAFPKSTEQASSSFKPVANAPSSGDSRLAHAVATAAPGEKQCPKCKGAMFDNRVGKKNPKAPDFKCKNKEGCDGVIWPPR